MKNFKLIKSPQYIGSPYQSTATQSSSEYSDDSEEDESDDDDDDDDELDLAQVYGLTSGMTRPTSETAVVRPPEDARVSLPTVGSRTSSRASDRPQSGTSMHFVCFNHLFHIRNFFR